MTSEPVTSLLSVTPTVIPLPARCQRNDSSSADTDEMSYRMFLPSYIMYQCYALANIYTCGDFHTQCSKERSAMLFKGVPSCINPIQYRLWPSAEHSNAGAIHTDHDDIIGWSPFGFSFCVFWTQSVQQAQANGMGRILKCLLGGRRMEKKQAHA